MNADGENEIRNWLTFTASENLSFGSCDFSDRKAPRSDLSSCRNMYHSGKL